MNAFRRGLLYHFTHVDNLVSVLRDGLMSDTEMRSHGVEFVEAGHRDIKARRRGAAVSAGPGGFVAGYVPFYFAPRSPMLSAIRHGRVSTYSGGQDDLIYLVSSVERLVEHDMPLVFTDRNAALGYARHSADLDQLDDFVDWNLMEATMWKNTEDEPDRKERRMAEMLVQRRVPWSAMIGLAVRTNARIEQATSVLAASNEVDKPVKARPNWYFT